MNSLLSWNEKRPIAINTRQYEVISALAGSGLRHQGDLALHWGRQCQGLAEIARMGHTWSGVRVVPGAGDVPSLF
jgi:hypothetical protein